MGILNNIRTGVVSSIVTRRWLMRPGMKGLEFAYYVGRVPLLKKLHPWTSGKKNSCTYLPIKVDINQEMGQAVNEIYPPQVVHDFIDKASHIVRMNKCLCRNAQDCENHTHDIGCMFMGKSALGMPPQISKEISKEEAHEHVEKAVADGLVPMAGKVRVDNFAFLIPDRDELLSVCFCCHCCCMMGYYRHAGEQINEMMVPLEGVKITVNPEVCQGCGTCVETCIFDAISIKDGIAVHSDACRACGRCTRYCPNGAVTLSIENANYKDAMEGRVESYVDWGQGKKKG